MRNRSYRYVAIIIALFASLVHANDQLIAFNIPQQSADGALNALAEQADISVVFDHGFISQQEANWVKGRFTIRDAVEALLTGTLLKFEFDSTWATPDSPDINQNPGMDLFRSSVSGAPLGLVSGNKIRLPRGFKAYFNHEN